MISGSMVFARSANSGSAYFLKKMHTHPASLSILSTRFRIVSVVQVPVYHLLDGLTDCISVIDQ